MAHGVDRAPGRVRGGERDGGDELHRIGDALELVAPARLVDHAADLTRHGAGGRGEQDLAAGGEGGNARGQVDRRAEVVVVLADRRPVVHPHPDRRRAVVAEHAVGEPEPERDRRPRLVHAQQHGVTDGLDLLGAEPGQQGADLGAEAVHELGGLLVAVRLGERGEPGDVGEEEGRLDGRHRGPAHAGGEAVISRIAASRSRSSTPLVTTRSATSRKAGSSCRSR